MAKIDFSSRAHTPELMDDAATGFEEFRACLRDLEQVNRLTLTYRPTLAFLDRLADAGVFPRDRKLVIVDVGSGYGGMLRQIDRWAEKRGIAVALSGVDLNPWSAAAAAEVTPSGRPIDWVTANLFDFRPPGGIDLIISSQFTHHLDDAGLIRFIQFMETTAALGWFIGDLRRHPVPYHAFRLLAWAARWHYFVRHDGPISITRAFTVEDWRRLLTAAGIPEEAVTIERWMPFRLCVARGKAL